MTYSHDVRPQEECNVLFCPSMHITQLDHNSQNSFIRWSTRNHQIWGSDSNTFLAYEIWLFKITAALFIVCAPWTLQNTLVASPTICTTQWAQTPNTNLKKRIFTTTKIEKPFVLFKVCHARLEKCNLFCDINRTLPGSTYTNTRVVDPQARHVVCSPLRSVFALSSCDRFVSL